MRRAESELEELKPRIVVVGIGGAGGNAVNNMIRQSLQGVEFIVGNTDAQALREALSPTKIQLGHKITQGLGAGAKPEVGQASAEESMDEIISAIKGSHMMFIAAGMGGGTGTGAAPVIAKAAKDMGILTVGVVTKPFNFEGMHRSRTADRGIEALEECVDTLIVIPNQNLFRIANERTTFADAFQMADNVLYSGVRGVTDLMIMPGLINLDFADVRTVMGEMGKAMMGTGEASGENRAIESAEAAISNPLLDEVSMKGAKGVLINITGGLDMTLYEVDEAANRVRQEIEQEANIIFGSTFDERMEGTMRVSVVATGIADPKSLASDKKSKPKVYFGVPGTAPRADSESTKGDAKDVEEPRHQLAFELEKAAQGDGEEIAEELTGEQPIRQRPVSASRPAPSFWARLSGRGRAEEPESDSFAEEEEALESAPRVASAPSDGQKDEYDIPAFLRRRK